jgi:hypothetical protein
MESILRSEVREFIRRCERFAEFSHRHKGLTQNEREAVFLYFFRSLDRQVIPTPPQLDEDMAA